MADIMVHSLDNVSVGQRAEDDYINATALCQAAGKEWSHYRENKTTKEFFGSSGSFVEPSLEKWDNGPLEF